MRKTMAPKKSKRPQEEPWTHLDARGRASMVDVGEKSVTRREAVAEAWVRLSPKVYEQIVSGKIAKGDVFAVCRVAGISAGKRASEWIPLAHPLFVEKIAVDIEPEKSSGRIRFIATAVLSGKTGVEMEALVAVSAAALTLYDMCKAVDRGIVIGPIRLLRKSGGRSGLWMVQETPEAAARPGSRRTAKPRA